MRRRFASIYGVDFSGAALAGRNIWVARCTTLRRVRLKLHDLDRLEDLAGTAAREPALAHLVRMIQSSDDALWAPRERGRERGRRDAVPIRKRKQTLAVCR